MMMMMMKHDGCENIVYRHVQFVIETPKIDDDVSYENCFKPTTANMVTMLKSEVKARSPDKVHNILT
jgi:hypothetical protein